MRLEDHDPPPLKTAHSYGHIPPSLRRHEADLSGRSDDLDIGARRAFSKTRPTRGIDPLQVNRNQLGSVRCRWFHGLGELHHIRWADGVRPVPCATAKTAICFIKMTSQTKRSVCHVGLRGLMTMSPQGRCGRGGRPSRPGPRRACPPCTCVISVP